MKLKLNRHGLSEAWWGKTRRVRVKWPRGVKPIHNAYRVMRLCGHEEVRIGLGVRQCEQLTKTVCADCKDER